jgi:flagellar biosynthesis protein FlhF
MAEEVPALPTFARKNRLMPCATPHRCPPRHGGQAQPAARHGHCLPAEARKPAPAAPALNTQVMGELQSMKDLIEERFNTLTWLGQTRQNPIQSSLMHKLIRAGYSPAAPCADRKLPETPARRRRALADAGAGAQSAHRCQQAAIYEQGGVFALVGSTGVGKTTTTAKLAALCGQARRPQWA